MARLIWDEKLGQWTTRPEVVMGPSAGEQRIFEQPVYGPAVEGPVTGYDATGARSASGGQYPVPAGGQQDVVAAAGANAGGLAEQLGGAALSTPRMGPDLDIAQAMKERNFLEAQRQLFGAEPGSAVARGRENMMRLKSGLVNQAVYSPAERRGFATEAGKLDELAAYAKELGLDPRTVFANERQQQTDRAVAGLGQLGAVKGAEEKTKQMGIVQKMKEADIVFQGQALDKKLSFYKYGIDQSNLSAKERAQEYGALMRDMAKSQEAIASKQYTTALMNAITEKNGKEKAQALRSGAVSKRASVIEAIKNGSDKDYDTASKTVLKAIQKAQTLDPAMAAQARGLFLKANGEIDRNALQGVIEGAPSEAKNMLEDLFVLEGAQEKTFDDARLVASTAAVGIPVQSGTGGVSGDVGTTMAGQSLAPVTGGLSLNPSMSEAILKDPLLLSYKYGRRWGAARRK